MHARGLLEQSHDSPELLLGPVSLFSEKLKRVRALSLDLLEQGPQLLVLVECFYKLGGVLGGDALWV